MSSGQELQIYDAKKVLSHVRRQLNILKEGDLIARKKAIEEVRSVIEEYKIEMNAEEMEEILLEFSKILLNCFSDQSEKIREVSIQIYTELVARCQNPTDYLKYIFDILVRRLNCHDLEGIEGMDPKLIPTPSQKPHKMARLVEESEQVREKLLNLTRAMVEILSDDQMRVYVNEMISILSVLLMDPAPNIQLQACKLMSEFVVNFKSLVYHFTVKLARAILLPLTSKKSNIRIAAVQCLHDLLYCGTWKYTVEVFDVMVGFKDPNYVAIKEFYEPTHNLNYFATLINSPNPGVREAFLQMVGDLLVALPDRYDVETRLVPYFLSGLFDEREEIRVIFV